ncbi:hypothetical protein MRX96_034783 [Rhipicephalus microplus]
MTAELAASSLSADQLADLLPPSAVVFSDSRAALLTIAKGEDVPSIAQRLTSKFTVIVLSAWVRCVIPPNRAPTLQTEWKWQPFVRAVSGRRDGRTYLVPVPGIRGYFHRRLFNAYAQLGLPHVSPEHLLFPSANVSTLRRAFHALLYFFGDADLFTSL